MSNTFAHYTTSPFVLTKNRASNLNLFIVLIYFFPNGTQVQSQISFKEEELYVCLYFVHYIVYIGSTHLVLLKLKPSASSIKKIC